MTLHSFLEMLLVIVFCRLFVCFSVCFLQKLLQLGERVSMMLPFLA